MVKRKPALIQALGPARLEEEAEGGRERERAVLWLA